VKRYRVTKFEFDTRANVLGIKIRDDWKEQVKEHWRFTKRNIRQSILQEFGVVTAEQKLRNFVDLGVVPFSVVAFHNKFFPQVRSSFIVGSYYPALTGVCALGERILNHLIIRLREYYRNTKEYKKVYRKDSFVNWELAIDTLESWDVLLPEVICLYRKLKELRNKAIHFNPETEQNDRELALEAIRILSKIIAKQFSSFGGQPWFIPDTREIGFIKKEFESNPFIKEVYLPNSTLLGPLHKTRYDGSRVVYEDIEYGGEEITDSEFAKMFRAGHGS